MRYIRSHTIAVLLLLFGMSRAFAGWDSLEFGGEASVRAVVDGDTVILDRVIDGSDEVRLVGIQAPKLPLGRPGFDPWPLAEEAKSALERLMLGQDVRLYFGGRRMDRHGRLLAHLRDAADRWAQGEMLALGMARVYTFPDNRAVVDDMWAREREARRERRGIWSLTHYAVRTPRSVRGDVGTFQVVEGFVVDAAEVKGTVYLNFGADWRRDFTVMIDKRSLRMFADGGIDPLSWKKSSIRVRGWVRERNGPMIEASHPEQIEVELEKPRQRP